MKYNLYQSVFHSRPLSQLEVNIKISEGVILNQNERDKAFEKNYDKMSFVPEAVISKSLISLYSWKNMEDIKVITINKTDEEGIGSIWDPNMGPSTPLEVCTYCQQYDCPGHYGLIEFRRLVYNPMYIRSVISILRCVCRNCSRLLIDPELLKQRGLSLKYSDDAFNEEERKELDTLIKLTAGKRLIDFKYEERLKLMEVLSQKFKFCNREECKAQNNNQPVENYDYMVKDVFLNGEIKRKTRKANDKPRDIETGKLIPDPGKIIPIKEIYNILNKIPNEDSYLIGFTETTDDTIIRIIKYIFNEVSNNVKFFNIDFCNNVINNLDSKIIISSEWTKFLDDIKKNLDKFTIDIIEKYYFMINDIVTDNIVIYQDDLSDKIINQYKIPSEIRPRVSELSEKILIVIDNLINEIRTKLDESDFSKIVKNLITIFSIKVEDNVQRGIIKTKTNEIQKLIINELYSKVNNFKDKINTVIATEQKYNISKINALIFSSHPRDLIMKGLLVIPRIARPRIFRKEAYIHSSISIFYLRIIKQLGLLNEIELEIRTGKQSQRIKKRRTQRKYGKAPMSATEDLEYSLNKLYIHVRNLIFEKKVDKAYSKNDKQEPLSIYQLIQGKTALIRQGMMGKVVSYCGRTVAGPDPSLKFGEIRIPEVWAPILTKKIKVTSFNIKYLTKLLSNDNLADRRITHIIRKGTGIIKKVENKKYKLNIGDVVNRWLENGDRITVNRQPTLQKQSMMKYQVVLGKELTIGLHLSYTTPMNADFDGDEVNAWDPQDFEVEAETEIIMNVKNNLMSVGQNRPSMGLVMNSVTASYLITKLNYTLNPGLFKELYDLMIPNVSLNTLSSRLRKYGINPYSGYAILSGLFPENFYYNQKGVLIINGILISGRLKKSSVGVSNRSIIQDLYKSSDKNTVVNFFTNASWILNKWMIERGFSVGLLDMVNLYLNKDSQTEEDKNLKVLNKELANIYNVLETLATKLEDPIEESFRQKQITNLSNVTTGIGIKLANDALTPDNSIAIMTEKGAGTKGAVANIGQMMGAVGQQFLYGERMPMSITGKTRALPTFDENDTNPEAYGFIPTSFFTGLNPESLFFLQAGGRPSLLDTALKTQDTGSMQHKMVKAFENVVIAYDGSVRNSLGYIFSPVYNNGYDVAEMIMIDEKLEFSSFIDIKSLADELNLENGWIPTHVNEYINLNKQTNDSIINDVLSPPIKYVNEKDTTNYKLEDPNPHIVNYFELSRIIGARAKQLENNAKPLIDIGDEIDFVNIAMMEYEAGLLDDINVIQKYSDGSSKRIIS